MLSTSTSSSGEISSCQADKGTAALLLLLLLKFSG
jgi:hypothetical protein